MGLSAEQTNGALLALQQMVSKGTVQAELRSQLGERLPGAFQIARARWACRRKSWAKCWNRARCWPRFLPKFADQVTKELGGSVDDATKSAQAALNQFGNAWEDLKIQIATSGLGRPSLTSYALLRMRWPASRSAARRPRARPRRGRSGLCDV